MKTIGEGIFSVYKPAGMSSHAVVNRLRRITGISRIGHAGTLDPLACGVLVMGVGRAATKQLSTYVLQEKEYVAEMRLDGNSTTDDAEGVITPCTLLSIPELHDIEAILPQFIGTISQVPPVYSAVKISGQTAYSLARKGKEVLLEPREREVKRIEIMHYSWPMLQLKVVTGKGVYIRALARDIGSTLHCGGYLTFLERTRVGQFTKDTCVQHVFES